ncbi:MAG: hypothetical protein AAF802_11245, partial [Planctomycetota bacterium]
ATPLIEGQRVKLTGDVIDPGIDDGTFVDVLFGNGLGTVFMLQPGETSFETYVTYEDDGNYQIQVSATDDDGLKSSTETLSIAVANDAPSITLNPGNEAIFEATPWTLRGLIADSGRNDRYSITIDWDDPQGPGNTVLTDQGPNFEANYTFADDRQYQVTVTAVDVNDPSSTSSQTIDINVTNFAPEINQVTHNASDPASPLPSGQTVQLNGQFSELGTQDTVTGTIQWGDGTSEAISLNYTSATEGDFTASRQFASDGSYIIKITLSDDDGGVSEYETVAFVGQVDSVAPTVDIIDVSPDPRLEPVGLVNINFDEAVEGFTIGDLRLTRDGAAIDITALPITEVTPSQYTIDLTSVTETDGYYNLTLQAANSNVTDLAGNALSVDANDAFYKGVVPSRVESIVYDDDSGQRSVVRSITVKFDSLVNVAANAFIVTTKDGDPVDLTVSTETVNSKTEAKLTFSGDEVDATGSLNDGNYQLQIIGSQITDQSGRQLDGDGDLIAGGNAQDDFFRLFGDSDGDRDVDGVDFLEFRSAFRTTNADLAFNPAFDKDGDGDVDGVDFLAFRDAFRTRLDA